MAAPTWQAATAGNQGNAGHLNQFLAAHTSVFVYSGSSALQAQQATGSATYQSTSGTYFAQAFTTGAAQSAIGQVALQISAVGGSPLTATIAPLSVSLYASASGTPTGPALATVTVTEPYVYSAGFWVTIPLVSQVTASTAYFLVTAAAGTSSAYYAWQQASAGTAMTSPDGSTWTAASFGLMYQVYDATAPVIGMPSLLVDDGGARTSALAYTAGLLTSITETTAAQGGGAFTSTRALAYSGLNLIGVS